MSTTERDDRLPPTPARDHRAGRGAGATPAAGLTRFARVPRVTAGLLTALAALTAAAAVNHAVHQGFEPVRETIDSLVVPAPANLAYSAFAVLIAAAVARRKRIAYRLLLVLMCLNLLNGLSEVLAVLFSPADSSIVPFQSLALRRVVFVLVFVLQFAAVVVLFRARRQFYARVRRAASLRALLTLVVAYGVGVGLAVALTELAPGSLADPGERLIWAFAAVGGGDTGPLVTHSPPGWVAFLAGGQGAAALLISVRVLLRSQNAAAVLSPADEAAVRGLLGGSGGEDSLGYFATRRDKAAVFSRTGKAAVTYRVVLGVCLASGDPIGDPDAWDPAIEEWLALARGYAWIPAVMGAGERGATAYARAGLKVLEIGDEAVLHVDELDLEHRDLRPVRHAVNRLRRSGHTVRIRRHRELTPVQLGEAARLAEQWRVGDTERGFSMALSRFGDPADGECVLVEALDPRGTPVAMLSFVPWGPTGLSLDVMRRSRGAENGLTELMVVELAENAGRLGVHRLSLNFAVFRSAFEDGARIGAGPVAKVWRRLLMLASRWWQLESLYRANAKYRPEWVPRFLCYAERRELVRISLASAAAEGFLSLPGRGPHLSGPTIPVDVGPSPAPALTSTGRLSGEATGQPTGEQSGEQSGEHRAGPVSEQVRVRLATLERIRGQGVDPYPVGFERTGSCADVVRAHGGLGAGQRSGDEVALAGRVILIRNHGGVVFVTLRDWSGDLQLILDRDGLGAAGLRRFVGDVDLGDHVGVRGEPVASRRGELSVLASSWTLTAKCLHPLPHKVRGLTDPEARARQRYVDLIVRPAARDALRTRAAVVSALRQGLASRDFIEVETPLLQPVHGGAAARPFTTHLNALDLDLYLRIAPELYLKRLCVGGVERVFELGRTFRNEGLSYKHNPEFTMLEAYQAYADYRVMLDLARELVQAAATAAFGSPVARVSAGDGTVVEHDLSGPWPVRTVNEAISAALADVPGALHPGELVDADTDARRLRELAAAAGVPADPGWSRGAVLLELYERLVEARTQAPTFYLDFPTDVSPLTRPHRDDPRLAERWDLVAFGAELGTAYSELVDPVEQRRRLTEQSLLAAGGDPEAMQLDEDFLLALEHAMPPSGGLGLGVDRLVMTLTGQSIRETLAFPLLRARSGPRSRPSRGRPA